MDEDFKVLLEALEGTYIHIHVLFSCYGFYVYDFLNSKHCQVFCFSSFKNSINDVKTHCQCMSSGVDCV